ncbi:MAG: HDIG domain-containing protein [Abditibacteriota bacterium]|nr:HDIG domain-containing protein [Abditibacteriota bacterium]
MAVATIACLSVLLCIHLIPARVSLKVGDVSDRDIIAAKTVRYIDEEQTKAKRDLAAAAAEKSYDHDSEAANLAVDTVRTLFHIIGAVRSENGTLKTLRDGLGTTLGSSVSDRTLDFLLKTPDDRLSAMEDVCVKSVTDAMAKPINSDGSDLRVASDKLFDQAARVYKDDPDAASACGEVCADALRPNRIYNRLRTKEARDAARQDTPPVYRLIMRGDTVISKGETVLKEHTEKFEALGLTKTSSYLKNVTALTCFVTLLVLLVIFYLRRCRRWIYENTRLLLLLSGIIVLCTLALRVGGVLLGITFTPQQAGYLGVMWTVAAGMLIATLINRHVSIVVTIGLSVVLSMVMNGDSEFAVEGFLMGLAAVCSISDIRGRSSMVKAMLLTAATGLILVLVLGAIDSATLKENIRASIWAAVIVPLGAMAVYVIATVPLERLFGITSHVTLLELADTNRPLLRRMVMEAPGTYTHSMFVGLLAESAAEAVGADPLVARVGAYYHDIGKLRRPGFFVENQVGGVNVHDGMNPTLSALVITSHIKDGAEIADEYKLPPVVKSIINEHHGTALVTYFYSRAAESEAEPDPAFEQHFRYRGPKPKSKESAIVMLADSVEAASRSLTDPEPAKIELLIENIIDGKLRDGQLSDCALTFGDVGKIGESFMKTLKGTLHARIEYPDPPAPSPEKK